MHLGGVKRIKTRTFCYGFYVKHRHWHFFRFFKAREDYRQSGKLLVAVIKYDIVVNGVR